MPGYFCFSKCTHLQGSIQRLLLPPCNWSALYFRKRQNISAAGKMKMILCRLLFFLQFLCASSALYVFSPRRLQLCFLGIVLCSNLPCYIALASLFQPSSKQFTHHDPRMKETFFRASLGSQQTQLHKPTGLCCVSHSQTCCFFLCMSTSFCSLH